MNCTFELAFLFSFKSSIKIVNQSINLQGEIYTENSIVQHCTYAEIYEHNEVYFPIVRPENDKIEEEFLSQNYWKPDFPDIDEDELTL